jgi:hypothetical protein
MYIPKTRAPTKPIIGSLPPRPVLNFSAASLANEPTSPAGISFFLNILASRGQCKLEEDKNARVPYQGNRICLVRKFVNRWSYDDYI